MIMHKQDFSHCFQSCYYSIKLSLPEHQTINSIHNRSTKLYSRRIPQTNMAPEGWHTGEQIRDHKLATSIINGHQAGEDEVLDSSALDLLHRFCADPSTSTRDAIVAEHGWTDAPGDKPGTKAADDGNLAGHCIARYGTEYPAFDDKDIEMLKKWFGQGMPVGEHLYR